MKRKGRTIRARILDKLRVVRGRFLRMIGKPPARVVLEIHSATHILKGGKNG